MWHCPTASQVRKEWGENRYITHLNYCEPWQQHVSSPSDPLISQVVASVVVIRLVVAWHCCCHCLGGWQQLNGDHGHQEVVVGGSSGDKAQMATASWWLRRK